VKAKILIPIASAIMAVGILLIAGASIVLPTVRAVGKLLAGV